MEAAAAILGIVAIGSAVALAMAVARARRHRAEVRAVADLIEVPPSGEEIATAIHRMRRRLDQSEHETALAFATLTGADLGILITDAAGAVTYANPAAEQYIGARNGTAVAQVRVRQLIHQAIEEGRPEAMELNLYTPVRRVLSLRARPIASGQGAVAVYIEDLTEQRRIDAMRRDFVANVSHELKTPLGALSVLSETLGDTPDPIVRKRLADRLADEAARMARLVDDILDLSDIESSQDRHGPLDLVEIATTCRENAALRARDAGVSIVPDLPDAPLEVVGDRHQLTSAIGNLLENAIKYTAVDRVAGETATVSLRVRAAEGDAVVEVIDEGIGIAEKHQDRIFERFYRVDRARSRETGGTGLGLSIVRNVMRNHGGTVTVESREGVGSTFTLRLPLRVS